MPLITYQSFNANSSSTHALKSISLQRFTKDANRHAIEAGHQVLVLPNNINDLATPIQGPANLVPIEVLTTAQTIHDFGAQISLLWQNLKRALGSMPDIMVCGELDVSHSDFWQLKADPHMNFHPVVAKKACQSFTAIWPNSAKTNTKYISHGEGYTAFSVYGLIVVFVHVPNRIATSAYGVQDFYFKIAHSFGAVGKTIDLVIGDTNQNRFDFTADILNIAFNTNSYKTAGTNFIIKVDNYDVVTRQNVSEKGTNSTGTKMYDVAVYRSDLVRLGGVAYISQSSGGVTVTDHSGLGIIIDRI